MRLSCALLLRPRRHWLPVVALAGVLLSVRPAVADLIVSVQSVTGVSVGSTGETFQVNLTNTAGSAAVALGGFSFGLSVSDSHIVLTQVDVSTTNPYIFAGHSLFGPIISNPAGGQSIVANDLYDVPDSGILLAGGSTVGLGDVVFNVLGSATPGAVSSITLDPFATSLTEFAGNDVPITTLSYGSITVAGTTATPEPPGIVLVVSFLAICLLSYMGWRWRCGGSGLFSQSVA
jgi:hypothetical protein